MDDYTQGWIDADEAILLGLSVDYSQGLTEWDNGWNARLALRSNSL